ncbi:MAG: Hsp20/alpha crystallin family protein [Chitinophagaceae bacterium]|nr:MAG: Hsp20/alpha crystallin family protein [Chitinophagaceae bacterium]
MATHSLMHTDSTPTLFSDLFRPWSEWFINGDYPERTTTLPAVNVSENKDRFQVALAAPGLQKEDFHIDVDDNQLTISAEKEERRNETEERFTRREYSFSSFSRSFRLPANVQADKIEAQYQNGVLTIALPKKKADAKAVGSKRIEVK